MGFWDWDGGLGLGMVIEDWEVRLRFGIVNCGLDQVLGLGIGIGDSNWGLGLVIGIGIWDWY